MNSYRSPIENFIDLIDNDKRDVLRDGLFRKVLAESKSFWKYSDFSLNGSQRRILTEKGIPLHPNGCIPHPHPASKTIENYMLHVVLKEKIRGIKDDLNFLKVISMKESKFKAFKSSLSFESNSDDPEELDFDIELKNRLYDGRDVIRYGSKWPGVKGMAGHRKFISNMFPKRYSGRKMSACFIHDEIHHWGCDDLTAFLKESNVDILFFSAVYPVEAHFGSKLSLNPDLYEFQIKGNKLCFFPDGQADGFYEQRKNFFLLDKGNIEVDGTNYGVFFEKTIGAHHFGCIIKNSGEDNRYRFFNDFTHCNLTISKSIFAKSGLTRFESTRLLKMVVYMSSLKKPDIESSIAKLRQLSGEQLDNYEVSIVKTLGAVLTSKTDWNSDGFFSTFFDSVYEAAFGSKILRAIGLENKRRMFDLSLRNGFKHNFCIDLKEEFVIDDLVVAEEIIENIDDKFHGAENGKKKVVGFEDRKPAEYNFLCNNGVEEPFKDVKLRMNSKGRETYNILTSEKDRRLIKYSKVPKVLEMIYGKENLRRIYANLPKLEYLEDVMDTSDSEDGELIMKMRDLSVEELRFINRSKRNSEGNGEEEVKDKDDEDDNASEQPEGELEEGEPSGEKEMPEEREDSPFPDPHHLDESALKDVSEKVKRIIDAYDEKFEKVGRRKVINFSECSCNYRYGSVENKAVPMPHELFEILEHFETFECYNQCLLQIYDENARIGFHRDDEDVYNDTAVLTVNLFGDSLFSIEMDEGGRNDYKLSHGDFIEMEAGFQSISKHAVTSTSQGRVSLTYREMSRCACRMNMEKEIEDGKPEELTSSRLSLRKILDFINTEGDKYLSSENMCLPIAISEALKVDIQALMIRLVSEDVEYWGDFLMRDLGSDEITASKIAECFDISITIMDDEVGEVSIGDIDSEKRNILLSRSGGHVKLLKIGQRNDNGVQTGSDAFFKKVPGLDKLRCASKAKINYSFDDATNLSKSFLRGEAGILLSSEKSDVLSKGKAISRERGFLSEEVLLITGFAGSGKTYGVKNLCKPFEKTGKIAIVSPRSNLKEDWKSDGFKNSCTFEVFLTWKKDQFDLIIFDEAFLFPNGYFDLVNFMGFKGKKVLIGDPLQAGYHCVGGGLVNKIPSLCIKLECEQLNYYAFSNRLNRAVDTFKELPIQALGSGNKWKFHNAWFANAASLYEITSDEENAPDVFLVASFEEKKLVKGKIPIMTFGESQGLTFNRVCIVVTSSCYLTDDNGWMVALTRAREGFCFLRFNENGLSSLMKKKGTDLVGKFLNHTLCSSYIKGMFKANGFNNVKMLENNTMCNSFAEEKMEGDPWLKPFIFLGQTAEQQKALIADIKHIDVIKTHLPIAPENVDFAEMFESIKAKEFREFKVPYDMSSQFIDQQRNDKKQNCLQPMLFESIYPRHKADDEVTFWAAVKKRLRFSNPERERSSFESNYSKGKYMFENFLKFVNLDPTFDEQLLETAQMDFEEAKLKKSKATMEAHSSRSCADWEDTNIFLFMKSQLCTKLEKRFVDAKAGQTLACFSHLVLGFFSKWCRYIDKKLAKALKKGGNQFYIHTRKNFDELNDYVIGKDFESGCTESDYEAFDASQDSIVLAFEVELMKFFKFPENIIEAYKFIKFNLRCKLGSFAIMRFTGEFCTFLFNTLSNMAFTFMRYKVDKKVNILFAGDDMCANQRLQTIIDHESVLDALSLKAKVTFPDSPTFCGWKLTKFGIVKNPKLIWERFQVAKERDTMKDCLESYCIESCYAYGLGDRLFDVCDEEELFYYQLINRLIVKNINKISFSIRGIFSKTLDLIENGSNRGEQIQEGIFEDWKPYWGDSE